ncbi:unnamed protein product [Rotaria sordida]|uniref:DNA polymerase epsilon catalytic subunit n=1 Tax=Rotaria sordida TaxID=392033 RepID=A0A814NSB3_9BILA|nr:unnamed protein product [Rotaria sordida]CAF1095181.1 unnamed protein product [Rotaria sordida]CAF1293128.1 unnamed protein product [Rotaria sordida]
MNKNRFFADGNSSSSEENSDDEPQIKIQTTKSFVKSYIINNDDDDDTENVKRIVRSEKDKRYEEIEENIKKIKQVIRIRDIKQVYECFENLIKVYDKARRVIEKEQIIPRFYIKILVQLEDFVNECWNNKDWCNKFNKTNSNNLKILRQKLRQYIQIESFQNEKNSYREVNDDVVEINETSSSDDFSSENNDDSIDNELPLNQSYINFFLQNTTITKRREKECKSIRQSDEKKFKEITSKEDILKFDNDKEILKKLNEIVSTRGKHSTNYHDQFEYLNNLRQYVKKQNLCVEIDIKILLIDITISFDYHQKENRYSKFETWTRILDCIEELVTLISENDHAQDEHYDLLNHLSSIQGTFIRLRFHDINDLMKARKELQPIVKRNIEREKEQQSHPELVVLKRTTSSNSTSDLIVDGLSNANVAEKQIDGIIELREFDVPYHIRVYIDLKINVGLWYGILGQSNSGPQNQLLLKLDLIEQLEPIIFAFDIECTKIPLKFPSAASDQIMMISYMIDTQGYLIINYEISSQDIDDFEYTPNEEYPDHFHVFNQPNEFELIKRFFNHIIDVKPHIY